MLTPTSVRQVLDVLNRVRRNRTGFGMALDAAYHDAVQKTADEYRVRYQTIGDACRRRLNLDDVDQFLKLVSQWLAGTAAPLRETLKRAAKGQARDLIDAFFDAGDEGEDEGPRPASTAAYPAEQTINVNMSERTAGLLRALAALEQSTLSDTAARLLTEAVHREMRSAVTGPAE